MIKYGNKDFIKGYENGIINKAYCGLSNDYLWKSYNASIESIYGLRMASTDYILYTRAHDDAPLLMSIGGNSYQFARGWDAGEGYYTRLYQIGGSEVGRWLSGEMVEVSYDVPIQVYNLNHFVEDYEAEIAEMEKVGRVVYQRMEEPFIPKDWFRFLAIDDGTFTMSQKIQYSLDSGATWNHLEASTSSPLIHSGEYICWKRDTLGGTGGIGTFTSTGRFEALGHLQSLVVADRFIETEDYVTNRIYDSLFENCTGITNAESIVMPKTLITQSNGCYYKMFYGCTNLKKAPELPATVLADSCYNRMFYACTSLNHIKCMASDISASNCTYNWLYGVAANGTFYAKASTNWSSGDSGIPNGWTRVNI